MAEPPDNGARPRGLAPIWYRITTTRVPGWAHLPLAIVILTVSMLVAWGIDEVEPTSEFHAINIVAVLIVATFFGREQALLIAIVGTLLTDYFFAEPRFHALDSLDAVVRILIYGTFSIVAASLVGALREALVIIDHYRLQSENLSRMQRDVLAIVTHDLRNPIFGLSLQATRLQRLADRGDLPSDTVRDAAATIQSGADQMRGIVEDLHDAIRIELGSFAVQPTLREPADILHAVVELLGPVAEAQQVRLVSREAPDLPAVCCDRLEQAIGNLVSNALKFSPRGGTVEVAADRVHDRVAFTVRDEGPGISATDLPTIFDRYGRGAREGARGTGLGLFIARGIVRSNRGEISVISVPGRGATFTISLPAARRPEPATEPEPPDASPPAPPP